MRMAGLSIAVCGLLLAAAGTAQAHSPQPGYGPGMMLDWGHHAGHPCPWHQGWMEPGGHGRGMHMRMHMGYRMGFGIIDLNHDGRIEADEAAAHAEDMFAALDLDDDEALTPDEFMAGPMGRRHGMGMGMGMGHGPRSERMQAHRQARFKELDKDGDGVVDRGEFLDGAAQRFAAADQDKDGKVDVWQFRRQRGL